jgi:tetratricopeptide (TPR) repeat protein
MIMCLKKLTCHTFVFGVSLMGLPSAAMAQVDPRDSARLQACITKSNTSPEEAFEDGLVWRSQSGGAFAEQCVALARIAKGDIADGAARLAALARAPDAGDTDQRALLLVKAANAWLMIGDFNAALRATNAAMLLKPAEVDILIDRARTFAGLRQWPEARDDLTLALSKRPRDALALRLRAETNLQQGNYQAAQLDVAEALRLQPRDVDNHVMRGRVMEARRLGRVPD